MSDRELFLRAFDPAEADRLIAEGLTFSAAVDRKIAELERDVALFPAHAVRIRNLRALLAQAI